MPKILHEIELAKAELNNLLSGLSRMEQRLESIRNLAREAAGNLSLLEPARPEPASQEEIIAKAVELVLKRLPQPGQAQTTPKLYLRTNEAAKALGVSRRTLENWKALKEPFCPPYVKIGKMTLYPVSQLEKHINRKLVRWRIGRDSI